ncbi:uncharacterized protein DKFZp434B061-like [Formica exsecta]|uniref:uncharacterized protein DKFZp434B061-like n=1 Tax=Formica exsecta TaxID=72781 RepID=UPI001144F0F3|nr:uncharacterized protein DKFZp434B061-like [Formica exsecta]
MAASARAQTHARNTCKPNKLRERTATRRQPGVGARKGKKQQGKERPRPLPPPSSPGPSLRTGHPVKPPTSASTRRHLSRSFQEWKLQPLELSPVRFTRPGRDFLTTWDVRVRRYTSPTYGWNYPPRLSPLPPSPAANEHRHQETQTAPSCRIHRGTQSLSSTSEKATQVTNITTCERTTQSDLSDWEEAPRSNQPDEPPLPERSYTSPGTPPALRTRFGPPRYTSTDPPLQWRERLL